MRQTTSGTFSALIQAARAGHADVIKTLLECEADAGICNFNNENALHFLVNLEGVDGIDDLARQLAQAGARVHMSSCFSDLDNPSTGCAVLRAVAENNPLVLSTLLDIEAEFTDGNTEIHVRKLGLLNLLHAALKLHRPDVLPIISKRMERVGLEIESLVNSRQFPDHNGPMTLLEICVFGHAPPVPEFGYNFPEQWSRIARSGRRYRDVVGDCIDFLLNRGAILEEEGIVRFTIERQ